jgi:hypothetical protein
MNARSIGALAGLVVACAETVALDAPPDTSGYVSAILVVARGGAVDRVLGYRTVPAFDRLTYAEDETLHLFLYAQPLDGLGLTVPAGDGPVVELEIVGADDPPAVGLPAAASELVLLTDGEPVRWSPLDARPQPIDELLLRGFTAGTCAELGGCFLDEAARDRLACSPDCADRVAFEVAPPALPRLAPEAPCRDGWFPEDARWSVDAQLAEVATELRVRACAPPVARACAESEYQPALSVACVPLATCTEAAQLAALPDDTPIAYVPTALPGGPAGNVFDTLAGAAAALGEGGAVVVGPGEYVLPDASAPGLVVVGRCPAETTLTGSGPLPTGLTLRRVFVDRAGLGDGWRVESSRVRLVPQSQPGPEDLQLRDVRLEVASGVTSAATVFLWGQVRALRVDVGPGVDWRVVEGADAELTDVRFRGADRSAALVVAGAARARDVVADFEEAPGPVRVGSGGRLDAEGLAVRGAEPGTGLIIDGEATVASLRLVDGDVWVRGPGGSLSLRDAAISSDVPGVPSVVRVTDGASLVLERVTAERTGFRLSGAAASFVDFAAKGDELLRVDPRTPEEVDVVTRYVGIVADSSSVALTRAAFVDVPAVLAGRRTFAAAAVDLLVSRPTCEPFAFGPGPVREGLDQDVRDSRPCENLLYDADYPYPHPPPAYDDRFAVKLERVWVRSAGLAGPFRNELQVVGAGTLDVDDLRFVRTTSRGLLVQGPVALDVRRAVFAEPGIQGACFFPAVRLEPTSGFGVGPSDPTGILEGVLSDGMDVGFAQLIGADVEPDLAIRDYVVRGAEQGIFRARATDRTFAVPFAIEDFLVRNALVDVDVLQGATPNESCD